MTENAYQEEQKRITALAQRVEEQAVRRIRKATRELILPLVRRFTKTGVVSFPRETVAQTIIAIIQEEGEKPAAAARKLQAEYERAIEEKLGVNLSVKRKNAKQYTDEDWKEWRRGYKAGEISEVQWRLFEKEYYEGRAEKQGRQSFMPEKLRGAGFGAGTAAAGQVFGYRKDPMTGGVKLDQVPLEYLFSKRYDLSPRVWKAVEQQEQAVFSVLQGGRVLGRNVKEIAKDLETYINYSDGGKRVQGRWLGMFANTKQGRREAWKRQYLSE